MAVQARQRRGRRARRRRGAAVAAAPSGYLVLLPGRARPTRQCADQRRCGTLVPEDRLRVYDVRAGASRRSPTTGSRARAAARLRPRDRSPRWRGIDGRPVGVLANDPRHLGGAIDADGADKAARVHAAVRRLRPAGRLAGRHAGLHGRARTPSATGTVRHASAACSSPARRCACRSRGRAAQGLRARRAGDDRRRPPRAAAHVAWPTGEFGRDGPGGRGAARATASELEAIADAAEREQRVERPGRAPLRARQGAQRGDAASRSTTSSTPPRPAGCSSTPCARPTAAPDQLLGRGRRGERQAGGHDAAAAAPSRSAPGPSRRGRAAAVRPVAAGAGPRSVPPPRSPAPARQSTSVATSSRPPGGGGRRRRWRAARASSRPGWPPPRPGPRHRPGPAERDGDVLAVHEDVEQRLEMRDAGRPAAGAHHRADLARELRGRCRGVAQRGVAHHAVDDLPAPGPSRSAPRRPRCATGPGGRRPRGPAARRRGRGRPAPPGAGRRAGRPGRSAPGRYRGPDGVLVQDRPHRAAHRDLLRGRAVGTML